MAVVSLASLAAADIAIADSFDVHGSAGFERNHHPDAVGNSGKNDANKSPVFKCVKCGAWHGGLYGKLCPQCGYKQQQQPTPGAV